MEKKLEIQTDTPVLSPIDGTGWYQQNRNLRLGLTKDAFAEWVPRKWPKQNINCTWYGNYRVQVSADNTTYMYHVQMQRVQLGKSNTIAFQRKRLADRSHGTPRVLMFGLLTDEDGEILENDKKLYCFEITDPYQDIAEMPLAERENGRYSVQLSGERQKEGLHALARNGSGKKVWQWITTEKEVR